jgi:hypothetical protein
MIEQKILAFSWVERDSCVWTIGAVCFSSNFGSKVRSLARFRDARRSSPRLRNSLQPVPITTSFEGTAGS